MAQDYNNQVIGLVRFSFPALSGFSKGGDDLNELEAFLYDPERLERRFYLFEKLCLPSLLAQTDPDFTCVFLVGNSLPLAAKDNLKALLAPLSNARIVARESEHNYAAIRKVYDSIPQDGFSHRTSFRLDDDDAVSNDYIKRLKRTARKLEPLCKPKQPIALSFNRGFYVQIKNGENRIFDACERTPLSVGSALFAQAGHPENVYARNHRFLGQFFNLYSDVSEPNFIRAIHRDNDSDPVIVGHSNKLSNAEIKTGIDTHFPIPFDTLQDL
ncbi:MULTISPECIES: glycosyltransferase [Falsihalocynthiibacter]|uniref:glycosyltransferase n=1 Tax=Falsihalocynthiibacter TaxID=2854182 RepID=UPI003001BB04